MLSERLHIIKALAPAADRYNTDPASDYISLSQATAVTFLLYQQGGTTGKATVTVLAASDNAGTGATAVAFRRRKVATGDSDTIGDVVATAAAGFDTTPAEDAIYEIEVQASELPEGKPFVALKPTEAANDPVNAVAIALLSGVRYRGTSQPTALT